MTQAPTPGPLSASRVGTNSGHGHAWKRPDGVKMRCGGTRICAECAKDAALVADVVLAGKQSLAPTAPVEASGSEREAFEKWYCDDAATVGIKILPVEILALREGETYGPNRVALNSKWEAWQARAALDHG